MRKYHQLVGCLCALVFWSLSASAQVAESGVAGLPVAVPPAAGSAPAGVGAAWEVMADMPEPRVFNGVAADANGYVYSVGGTSDASGTTATDSLFRYDTGTDSWATLTAMPVALNAPNAVVVNNQIYVPGDATTADTYVYDIAGDSWSVIPANGGYTARSQYQILSSGTDVIVLGGLVAAAGASTTEVWILDTVSETWSAGVPMQQSRTSFSAGLIDGQIVVAGGVVFPGFVPDMTTEIFDGSNWSFVAGVPDGGGTYTRWSYNAAAVASGQLWLAGGRRDAGWNILDHAGFYEPASDSWTDSPTIPTLNQPRVYMEGDVASDGYFYVIGGRDSAASTVYGDNERLSVAMLHEVGGAISGLLGSGLVLEEVESGKTVSLNAPDSVYAFSLPDGSSYDVQVQTQPGSPQQTCTVANATGTVSGADVSNVDVSCTTDEFNVGGAVNGLAGSGLELIEVDSGQTLSIAALDTAYAFSLEDGSSYDIQVQTQPGSPQQTCTVANATGTVSGTDVTNVDVSCITDSFSVGGVVSGLTGSGLELIETDSGQTQSVTAGATSHAFSLADGSSYNVQVNAQPAGQFCTVSNATGSVSGADVTDVDVACEDLTIGIDVGQLNLGTITVGQTGSDVLTVSNPGGAPLDLIAISLTDPDGVFSVSGGSCLPIPSALASGASCTIEVTMDGSNIGNYSGELVIDSTAASSPTSVGLSGSVAGVPVAVPVMNTPMLLLMMISLLMIGAVVLRTR